MKPYKPIIVDIFGLWLSFACYDKDDKGITQPATSILILN